MMRPRVWKVPATHLIIFIISEEESYSIWTFLLEQLQKAIRYECVQMRYFFHYLPPFKASWSNNSSTNESNEYDDQWNTHPSEEEYLTSNQQIIETIISQQIRNGFSPDKIFIGGFYRGASLALLVGLNSSLPLGGIICISPPIPFIKKFEKLTPIHQTQLKVFWSHGIKDLFDSTLQKISRSVEFFQDHSAPILIDFKTYPAQSPSPQEMNDLLHWILPLTK